jgi:hypothetical protein
LGHQNFTEYMLDDERVGIVLFANRIPDWDDFELVAKKLKLAIFLMI